MEWYFAKFIDMIVTQFFIIGPQAGYPPNSRYPEYPPPYTRVENVGGSSNTGSSVAAGLSGVIGAIGGAIIGAAVGGDTPHHGHHHHHHGHHRRHHRTSSSSSS